MVCHCLACPGGSSSPLSLSLTIPKQVLAQNQTCVQPIPRTALWRSFVFYSRIWVTIISDLGAGELTRRAALQLGSWSWKRERFLILLTTQIMEGKGDPTTIHHPIVNHEMEPFHTLFLVSSSMWGSLVLPMKEWRSISVKTLSFCKGCNRANLNWAGLCSNSI